MNNSEDVAKAIQAAVEGDATKFSKKISYLVGNPNLKNLNTKEEIVEKLIGGGATLQGCFQLEQLHGKQLRILVVPLHVTV